MARKKKIVHDFSKPRNVESDLVLLSFGVPGTLVSQYLPEREDLPEVFKSMNSNTIWHKIQQKWFFEGLTEEDMAYLVSKGDIDKKQAILHLQSVQSSWNYKHEHKVGGVAYLLSLWFEESKGMVKHFSKPFNLNLKNN